VRRVVITGAAGLIGGVLMDGLVSDYELVGLDRTRLRGANARKVDMTKLKRMQPAFEGAEVVIHLAANASISASWEAVHRNNLPADVNMFEAARRAGVERVVLASSNQVTGLYERDEPYASIVAGRFEGLDPGRIPLIASDFPVRPNGFYGIGKALTEAAARTYSEQHDLSVLCLRIGAVTRSGAPQDVRDCATLLSHRDLVELVRCCIEASPELRFGIYYGVSANRWRFWEIENARRELAYEPRDDGEFWRGHVLREQANAPLVTARPALRHVVARALRAAR
jgi:nucleoside-diphosphate-sugar epimerase